MFGVVVCPRCHRAKGVELSKRTTSCSCGFEIRVVLARLPVRVGTERELVEAVRRGSAELARGGAPGALGIQAVEESLDDLLRSNVVYEPREGFYRAVTPTP